MNDTPCFEHSEADTLESTFLQGASVFRLGPGFIFFEHFLHRAQISSYENTERIYLYKKRGKAVPLHTWSGPEGSRKLRFPDYMTTAQDGGTVVSLTNRPPLPPGNAPGTHFC
jgi:hypothetical protein